jgi:hypothetical protein
MEILTFNEKERCEELFSRRWMDLSLSIGKLQTNLQIREFPIIE